MPLLPIAEDVQATMMAIDRFNSKRRARCQLAQFYAELSRTDSIRYQFKSQNAYRSVPVKTECSSTVCYEKYHKEDEDRENTAKQDYCKYLLTEPEGSMFCATRVSQLHFMEGMNYYDYENLDDDFNFQAAAKEETETVDENKCAYNLDIILGAPMMCDGTVVGFVVMCHKRTLVFSSMTTIRNFLLTLINSSYLPTIYMDVTGKEHERSFSDPTSDTTFQPLHQQKFKMETLSSTSPLTHPFPLTAIITFAYSLFH
uniref:Prospero homeobox protein 1 n=1 Tax=Lygus hesperus TaxID=30085 RepID=A0A0A9XQN4_LYGHE